MHNTISDDNNSKFPKYQIRMLSAGLGMAWKRCGLSCFQKCYLQNNASEILYLEPIS